MKTYYLYMNIGIPGSEYILGSENGIWGMPSGDTTAAAVIGIQLNQSIYLSLDLISHNIIDHALLIYSLYVV